MIGTHNLPLAQPARACSVTAILALCLAVGSGCAGRRTLEVHQIGNLGRIEFLPANENVSGVVIGVSRGLSQPAAVEFAKAASEQTGAGLVVAYGFADRRVAVAQPLVHISPIMGRIGEAGSPGSVFSQYRGLARAAAGADKFYVGLRMADSSTRSELIEVATSGLSFEQLNAIKTMYRRIRDRELNGTELPKIDMAIHPLDDISWSAIGVRNHGVLLSVERGMILRMPKTVAQESAKGIYQKIITRLISAAVSIGTQNPQGLPAIGVQLFPLGRIESIPSRSKTRGIVIAAPHGSFDRHTSEVVQELSYRTGMAAVIARGFTPTEAGGWRINVNRPTERRYPMDGAESDTERARDIYRRFEGSVLDAAAGPLKLYVEVHQSSSEDHIDVATVGVSVPEAKAWKEAYTTIRDGALSRRSSIPAVNLLMEPVDKVNFTALGAKKHGMLRRAERALHIELPTHRVLRSSAIRRAYTEMLATWLARMTEHRSTPPLL